MKNWHSTFGCRGSCRKNGLFRSQLRSPAGRPPSDQYDDLTRNRFERNLYAPVHKMANSFGIAQSTLCRRSTQELGTKSFHLRWMAHQLCTHECRSMSGKIRTFETTSWNSTMNRIKYFSLNCDWRRVLVWFFIFTGNDVVYRQRWSRRSDRLWYWHSEHDGYYLLGTWWISRHWVPLWCIPFWQSVLLWSDFSDMHIKRKYAMLSRQLQIFAAIDLHGRRQSWYQSGIDTKTGMPWLWTNASPSVFRQIGPSDFLLFRRLQTRLVDRQCEIEDYLLAPLKGVTQSKCRPVRIPGFKEWIEPLQTDVRRNGDSAYSRAFFLDARIFRHFILSSLDGYGKASTSNPLD